MASNSKGFLNIVDENGETVYGATPEIESAINLCIENIWQNYTIEDRTGTIRRDEIRRYIQETLNPIDEAQLSQEEFDKYFK